jgi:hypothetical protein
VSRYNPQSTFIFRGLASLQKVNLIESSSGSLPYDIDDQCFQGCTSLNSINIPNSISTIGASAFEGQIT